ESQRSENVKEGVGYNAVPPPAANLYHSLKKDLSWTGLSEFADDTVTDYSRPSPTVESTSTEDKDESVKKPAVRYAEMYIRTSKRNFPPINRKVPTGNSNVSTICCCCSRHVNIARPKAVINRRNRVTDVQVSASWVWKSIKPNSASIILKRYDYKKFPLLEESSFPLVVQNSSHC
nr:hypothetical protein [Tanacetum cinerariifolium]